MKGERSVWNVIGVGWGHCRTITGEDTEDTQMCEGGSATATMCDAQMVDAHLLVEDRFSLTTVPSLLSIIPPLS